MVNCGMCFRDITDTGPIFVEFQNTAKHSVREKKIIKKRIIVRIYFEVQSSIQVIWIADVQGRDLSPELQ